MTDDKASITFRLATEADLPTVMTIVAEARQFLHDREIPQWQGPYPTEATFLADIKQRALWVAVRAQKVVLMMTLLHGPDPNYSDIDGEWVQPTSEYLVMHRIAVTRTVAGQGVAQAAFAFALQQAQVLKLVSLRFDTHELNTGMRHLASKNDFMFCGTVLMADGTPRVAYEKLV